MREDGETRSVIGRKKRREGRERSGRSESHRSSQKAQKHSTLSLLEKPLGSCYNMLQPGLKPLVVIYWIWEFVSKAQQVILMHDQG